MNFLLETIRLGLTNLLLHKLRSFLTVLGIIFGVSAVIVMVAIGEGNKRKALADIEQLGARNVIVRSVKPPESQDSSSSRSRALSYGITYIDYRRILETVGPYDRLVPLKQVGSQVSLANHQCPAAVFGTTPQLTSVTSLRIDRGRYLSMEDESNISNVAVIGAEVARILFPMQDPLETNFRIDGQAFRVIGILKPIGLAGGAGTALVGRDLNFDIHIPMATARGRFGDNIVKRGSGSMDMTQMELSELYIEAGSTGQVRSIADQVTQVIATKHSARKDVTVIVPQELIEQAARTQRMFNTLMISIASISLVVGGIGIMNIMLATVTERTREIGIRRALGATRKHIVAQFLSETTVLSGVGGLLGVVIGGGAAAAISLAKSQLPRFFPEMGYPVVPVWAVVVSFGVAVTVGIAFGLYPAVKAASQDPIVALRHD